MFETLCLFYDIQHSLYSVLDESKQKKANNNIHNVLKSKFYRKQEYHTYVNNSVLYCMFVAKMYSRQQLESCSTPSPRDSALHVLSCF